MSFETNSSKYILRGYDLYFIENEQAKVVSKVNIKSIGFWDAFKDE